MSDDNVHFAIPALVDQWERRSISRREFLRTATLLGMSAAAAYRIVGLSPAALAAAQALPQGGTVRIAHPIKDVSNPQALNWFQFADLTFPVVQTLTRIGAGSVLGEQSFFDGQPRSASVWAVNDCEVAGMTPDEFRALESANPALARELLFALGRILAIRLRRTTARVAK